MVLHRVQRRNEDGKESLSIPAALCVRVCVCLRMCVLRPCHYTHGSQRHAIYSQLRLSHISICQRKCVSRMQQNAMMIRREHVIHEKWKPVTAVF